MNKTTALRALVVGAGVAAAGAIGMATASADDTQQTDLGAPAQIADGGTVQQWTVENLRPSGDVINYAPAGALWEATASNTAVEGGNVPFVPGFSAVGGQDNYPVLWGVASPQGVNPAGLAPGETTTGKVYFDVTGAAPDTVVFSGSGQEAVWVTPPPPPAAGGWGAPAPAYTPPSVGWTPQAPVAVVPQAPAAVPAPAAAAAPKAPAAAAGTAEAKPATGSSGTPIAAAPAPASTAPTAAAASPASQAPASPAPVSQAPATAAPASPTATTAPSGSGGTPLSAPATTVVPAPAG